MMHPLKLDPVKGPILVLAFLLLLVACGQTDQSAGLTPTAGPTGQTVAAEQNQTDAQEAGPAPAEASANPEETRSYAGSVPAPEFPSGLDWLNTDRPLTLADLRGKVVLLDFWTYGCINCIHIIPDLKKLEAKYADELVVIGVHSAKFENEADTENIRRIILRYELEHPVVNDNRFEIWNEYGARAWPTLVLIDPEGKVLGYHSGEGVYEPFDEVIGGMVAQFDALGTIDRTPLELKLEKAEAVESPLRFPGKVLADEAGQRLFIADSNHNRLVITDLQGKVLDVVGDGRPGLQDGDFETARFFRPQGLTLADPDTLYIADTENHAIRKVDLKARTVETVAGTGQQVFNPRASGYGPDTPLNSPWDVHYVDERVYIAMAGQHQIWAYHPETGAVYVHAGSGAEELRDGRLDRAGLNQPSGLASDGRQLFIADSEASAIRTADLDPSGELDTIVGTGLFDFGDVDGRGDEVRLQHPLGIDFDGQQLYVADTYNSKIKRVDPANRESTTFLGSNEAGWRDGGEALFDEPGGLSLAGNRLYIADTNNHAIRVADLSSGDVSTLVLVDMEGLLTRQPADSPYNGKLVTLDEQTVASGAGQLRLDIILPEGYKVNDLAPFSMSWAAEGNAVSLARDEAQQTIVEPSFPITVAAEFSPGQDELRGDLIVYYCEAEAQSLCFIERVRLTAPVRVAENGADSLLVTHTIPVPER